MGSAPNAAATATVSHPVKQGFVQSLGVFVDTMVVCSATAFIILVSDVYDPASPGGIAGARLAQAAVADQLGSWSAWLMTILVIVFAFSSVLGNYSYAEINMAFLGANHRVMTVFRIAVVAAVGFGALAAVWALADVAMALMAMVNLVAIIWHHLAGQVGVRRVRRLPAPGRPRRGPGVRGRRQSRPAWPTARRRVERRTRSRRRLARRRPDRMRPG